jgi:hypothetical protein
MGTNVPEEPAISVFKLNMCSLKVETSHSYGRILQTNQTTKHDISEDNNLVLTNQTTTHGISEDNNLKYVRFEAFAVLTMKNAVFWDVTPCGSSKNRQFGGTYPLHHLDDKNLRARNNVSSN